MKRLVITCVLVNAAFGCKEPKPASEQQSIKGEFESYWKDQGVCSGWVLRQEIIKKYGESKIKEFRDQLGKRKLYGLIIKDHVSRAKKDYVSAIGLPLVGLLDLDFTMAAKDKYLSKKVSQTKPWSKMIPIVESARADVVASGKQFKKNLKAANPLHPSEAFLKMARLVGHDPYRALGTLAFNSLIDVRLAMGKVENDGNRYLKTEFTPYLLAPAPDLEDHDGQIYHFWGFAAREIASNSLFRGLNKLTTWVWDRNDETDKNADAAGRRFANGIEQGLAGKASSSSCRRTPKCQLYAGRTPFGIGEEITSDSFYSRTPYYKKRLYVDLNHLRLDRKLKLFDTVAKKDLSSRSIPFNLPAKFRSKGTFPIKLGMRGTGGAPMACSANVTINNKHALGCKVEDWDKKNQTTRIPIGKDFNAYTTFRVSASKGTFNDKYVDFLNEHYAKRYKKLDQEGNRRMNYLHRYGKIKVFFTTDKHWRENQSAKNPGTLYYWRGEGIRRPYQAGPMTVIFLITDANNATGQCHRKLDVYQPK